MKIIIGLGNIGVEYSKTYHNVGFLTIDKFATENGFIFTKNKCQAQVAEGFLDGEKIILAKPTTYMNNSGISARELLKKYGADESDLLIIVDDIDLPLGAFRFRKSGSSGTHNGLRSCVAELNTENFARLRIGIGKPENNISLADFVLSKISQDKMTILEKAMQESLSKIDDFIKGKI